MTTSSRVTSLIPLYPRGDGILGDFLLLPLRLPGRDVDIFCVTPAAALGALLP